MGSLASKVATELRLRKMSGADEENASIAEVNASLRDVTSRLKKDLEDARKIQQALLPKALPTHANFQLASFYEPLEEVGEIGFSLGILRLENCQFKSQT